MLQQILTDMYIEPELLSELNEEQKQILFFKMREEQVRRWKEREARLEKEEAGKVKSEKVSQKTVSWLKASNNDVWVWVMGEHRDDESYDQICDKIMAERAALQAQKEAEELRAKKEAELEKRFSGLYVEQEEEAARQEQARKAAALEKSRQEELKRREAEERKKAEEEVRRLKEERAQQIYMDLKDVNKKQGKGQDNEEKAWQDTLRKSKAADQRRRSLAKQTIEDHRRRSVKALERGRVSAVKKVFGGRKNAPEPKPQPQPKPKPRNLTLSSEPIQQGKRPSMRSSISCSNREEIIRWFREEQLSLRVCFQQDQSRVAPWFHGIISRQEAEDLLNESGPGSFLVRVSERIFGYVLSYRSQDEFKHFLIDATDNCYMLLGDQIKFTSLGELVEYHEEEPLTPSGGERLLQPCGQKPGSLDYTELFT